MPFYLKPVWIIVTNRSVHFPDTVNIQFTRMSVVITRRVFRYMDERHEISTEYYVLLIVVVVIIMIAGY